jgi:hypothetical protein
MVGIVWHLRSKEHYGYWVEITGEAHGLKESSPGWGRATIQIRDDGKWDQRVLG